MREPDISPNSLGGGSPARIGTHSMGGAFAGQMGRPHAYPSLEATALATVPNGYAITLEKEDGERKAIDTLIGDFSPSRDHSAISDWQATVPYDQDELEDYTFNTRAWITWDGRVIFTGYCKSVSSTMMDGESVLSGYGPGIDLDSGVYQMDFRNIQVWRAFEELLDDIAGEWSYHVTRPPDPIVIKSFEVSGTALECIEQLADEYNYNFLIDQSQWKHLEVFKPNTITGNASWETLDADRDFETEGYYNATSVIGARVDGERLIETYHDWDEIERHYAERDLDELEDAVEMQTVDETDVEDSEELRSIARARTEEAIAERESTGSIETYPMMVDPGRAYPVREWDDDAAEGPYSLWFDGDSRVSIPSDIFKGVDSGGFSAWVRYDSSQNSAPILGTDTFAITQAETLTLNIGGTTVDAAPAGAPSDEWILVHYDWSDGEVRAGYDGIIRDESDLSSSVSQPSQAWIGFDGAAHYEGYLDLVQVFSEPLTESQYSSIVDGNDVPASKVRARFRCNEGPNRSDGILYDARGGHHGEIHGAEYAGSPKMLENVQFSHGPGSADATLNFRKDHSLAAEINRMQREMQRRD